MNLSFYYFIKLLKLNMKVTITDVFRRYTDIDKQYSVFSKLFRRRTFKKNKLYIIPRFHPKQQKRT